MLKIFFYVWSKSRSTMMNLATFDRFFPGNNYNPENKNPQRSPLKPRLDLSLQNSSRQKQKIIFSLLFLFFILPTPLLCAFMKMPDFLKTQKAKDAAQKAKEAKAADKIAELNTEAARRLDVRSKELEARKNALEKRKSQIEANDKTINELENKAKNNNPQLTTQEQQSLENLKKEKEIFEREKKQLDADTKALEQAKDSASVVQQAETEKPATDQNEQDAIDLVQK